MAVEFTPYTTASSLFGAKPSWITNDLDIQRIQSYQTYEEIYWNAPDTFKIAYRGTNDKPIYIPNGMITVNTINTYTGAKFAVSIVDAATGGGDTPDVIAARQILANLFRRERFRSKYNGNKRYGIMRGDWVWHLTADPLKPEGSRIRLVAIDPGMYFPLTDENDVDEIIGCHLAVQITTDAGPRVHRLTYRKASSIVPGAVGIYVEEGIFKLDTWEATAPVNPEVVIRPLQLLPTQITAIPVYHVKNFDEPGNPFGSSELRGFEVLMGRINQTVSDADLALALEGIGLYATDAPEPTDPDGNPVGWRLGPGMVAQVPAGSSIQRVNGVGSVGPYTEHYNTVTTALRQAAATPDVAVGSVDVQIAQSGIALALQYLPLTAKTAEKNDAITDVHTNMMFDILTMWYSAYEATTFDGLTIDAVVGSAVPVDRAERVGELDGMLAAGVIDTQYYRDEMTKLGYVFPANIQERVDAEKQKSTDAQAQVLGTAQLASNAEDGGDDGDQA